MIAYNKIDKRFYDIKFSCNKTWRYITYYENGFGISHSYVSDENMEKDWLLPAEEKQNEYIAYCKKEHDQYKVGTFHHIKNEIDEDEMITCQTDVGCDWKRGVRTNLLYYKDWQHFCQYWDVN